jgi:hypothetical protein
MLHIYWQRMSLFFPITVPSQEMFGWHGRMMFLISCFNEGYVIVK